MKNDNQDTCIEILNLGAYELNRYGVDLIRKYIGYEFSDKLKFEQDEVGQDWFGAYNEDGELIGIIGLGSTFDAPFRCWLGYFVVCPDYWGKGVADKLLKTIERRCTKLNYRWLFVETYSRPEFERAIAFYKKHGFKIAGYLDNMLLDGATALYFVKDLKYAGVDDG